MSDRKRRQVDSVASAVCGAPPAPPAAFSEIHACSFRWDDETDFWIRGPHDPVRLILVRQDRVAPPFSYGRRQYNLHKLWCMRHALVVSVLTRAQAAKMASDYGLPSHEQLFLALLAARDALLKGWDAVPSFALTIAELLEDRPPALADFQRWFDRKFPWAAGVCDAGDAEPPRKRVRLTAAEN